MPQSSESHEVYQGFLTLMEQSLETASSDAKDSNISIGSLQSIFLYGLVFASLPRSSKLNDISVFIYRDK